MAGDTSVLRQLQPISGVRSCQTEGKNLNKIWAVHLLRLLLNVIEDFFKEKMNVICFLREKRVTELE